MFKVQNVNDSFMVASGVPAATAKKLGDRHASEIAKMALDIVESATRFAVPHRGNGCFNVRVGIHSGPAVGGVQKSGDILPRYIA